MTLQNQMVGVEVSYAVIEPDWPQISRAPTGGSDRVEIAARHRDKIGRITNGEEATAWVSELEALNTGARVRARREQQELAEAKKREQRAGPSTPEGMGGR